MRLVIDDEVVNDITVTLLVTDRPYVY